MPPTDSKTSENQALIDFAEKELGFVTNTVIDPNDPDGDPIEYAIVPTGKTIQSLKPIIDAFRTKPERRTGTAVLTTQQSFVDHVNRFKGESTVIFANRGTDKGSFLLAVYDYHPAGGDTAKAAFGKHRAKYPFPLSDQWKAWLAQNEKPMEPTAFAEFLEDRLQDVVAVDVEEAVELKKVADLFGGTFASPTKLLELSRSLEINASVGIKQAQTLSSGEINVMYTETHVDNQGSPIKVPNLFAIGIPVFVEGDMYRLAARLRYRVSTGRITWWYSLVNPARYFDDAVALVVQNVGQDTERPVLFGAPEAERE